MKKRTESDLVRECCEWLDRRSFFFWRCNNIPVFAQSNDGKFRYRSMPKFSKRGVPDIILITAGIVIGLEIKLDGAKLSEDQQRFKEKMQLAGGRYYTIHSTTELETVHEINLTTRFMSAHSTIR